MSVNLVILEGHLGADPELQYSADGKAYCKLSLCTNRHVRDQESVPEWHYLTAFGRAAEICAQLGRKGSRVLFPEIRMVPKTWTDRDGQSRRTVELWVQKFPSFLANYGNDRTEYTRPQNQRGDAQDFDDTDIPF